MCMNGTVTHKTVQSKVKEKGSSGTCQRRLLLQQRGNHKQYDAVILHLNSYKVYSGGITCHHA